MSARDYRAARSWAADDEGDERADSPTTRERKKAAAAGWACHVDLAAEAALDPMIYPAASRKGGFSRLRVAQQARLPRRVLLTGATGFLGAFALRALLRDEGGAVVYCLVRAADAAAAAARLVRNLRANGLWGGLAAALRRGRLLARALSRRYQAQTRGRLPDLRRTMRLMLRDGEILEIAQRQRRPRRLELDLICDVSKSMDVYSSFLIQFMYAFQHAYRRIETYVFSTSLHRITPLLKEPALQLALPSLAVSAQTVS